MPPHDEDVTVAPSNDAYTQLITTLGRSVGLDRVGICDTSVLDRARREIIRRRAAGLADTMQFTFRNPERSTDPSRALSGALSLVVGARRYVGGLETEKSDAGNAADSNVPMARVARYAQSDHYAALRQSLNSVADRLKMDGHRAAVFVDENDIVDREVAHKAGLGWFGKSANILIPGGGSWYVLGSVVTTASLTPASRPVPDGCGSCRVCIDACPTAAIVADGVIDARRCLAWLVQKEGIFPFEHRVALGNRIYGCDDCQDTCPPNLRFRHRHEDRLGPADLGPDVQIFDFFELDDDRLMSRFGRWYIAGRDPTWLRRNALIILGNVAPIPVSERVRRTIESCLGHRDPFLRAHAVWASGRLGLPDVRQRMAADENELVREELRRWDEIPIRTAVTG